MSQIPRCYPVNRLASKPAPNASHLSRTNIPACPPDRNLQSPRRALADAEAHAEVQMSKVQVSDDR